MNNYSWLQKKLHQFSLSSQFMREAIFDAECSFVSATSEHDNHVFVAGLARSGTTILLNALYQSNIFASLSYADMPFILAPNLWSKLSFSKKDINYSERSHGDGIKVSIESPEAFEEVFWKTFSDKQNESINKFKKYVQIINYRYQKDRYLSKNNQNIRRLQLISNIFPNSKILIPFRDPTQHAYSLLNQHKKFIEDSKDDIFISNYMHWIGHTEFGPNYIPIHDSNMHFEDDLNINHWMEQWYLIYKNCLQQLNNNQNVHFICYEKLCSSTDYWHRILEILSVDSPYNFKFVESKKDLPLDTDNDLKKSALALYDELISTDL